MTRDDHVITPVITPSGHVITPTGHVIMSRESFMHFGVTFTHPREKSVGNKGQGSGQGSALTSSVPYPDCLVP